MLDDVQAAPAEKVAVAEDKWITVPDAVGDVQVRIIKPEGSSGPLPAILYIHGGRLDPRQLRHARPAHP